MTIKGKKTGSLPKMTQEQIDRFNPIGELVDDSFPEEKLRAIPGIPDPDAFLTFLAPLVDRYRALTEHVPVPVAEELAWAEKTLGVIQELQVRLSNIPPHIEGEAMLAHWKRHKVKLHDATGRLDVELSEFWTVLDLSMRAVEPHGSKPGRKISLERNDLLTKVAAWIEDRGSKEDEAARVSTRVLFALGIPDPDKPATVIRQHKERLQQIGN